MEEHQITADDLTKEERLVENLVKTYFYDFEWRFFSKLKIKRYSQVFLNHDILVDR